MELSSSKIKIFQEGTFQTRKRKKKVFLIFCKMELSGPKIKSVLIFQNLELASPKNKKFQEGTSRTRKIKNKHSENIFFYFRKWNVFPVRLKSSYIFSHTSGGNW